VALPEALRPSDVLPVTLPDERTVGLPRCLPQFPRWLGPPVAFPFGSKPLVEHAQRGVWAEFKIMSLFIDAGWEAFVVQAFGGIHYLREMKRGYDDRGVALPAQARELFADIAERNGGFSGFFDVFASRGDELVFAEAKLARKDRLRSTQRRWIASVLAAGVRVEDLVIVEWEFAN
jgi:hypothetical protein